MAVFVPRVIAGELCRIKILKVGKTAAYGKLEELLLLTEETIYIASDELFTLTGEAAQRAQESQGRSGGAAARSKASGRSAKKGGGNRNSRARRGGELFFAVDGRDPFDDYLDATGPRPPRPRSPSRL